jgi:hypothetical protein
MEVKVEQHLEAARAALGSKDYPSAIAELRAAERLGSFEAKIELAEVFLAGESGPNGGIAAEALLQEVATSQVAPASIVSLALNNLATLYSTGADGVLRNTTKSDLAAREARRLGFPE